MSRYGAWTLGEHRAPRVVIECRECNRRGDYSTARLLQRYGADIAMPDLRNELAADCPNRTLPGVSRCKALIVTAAGSPDRKDPN